MRADSNRTVGLYLLIAMAFWALMTVFLFGRHDDREDEDLYFYYVDICVTLSFITAVLGITNLTADLPCREIIDFTLMLASFMFMFMGVSFITASFHHLFVRAVVGWTSIAVFYLITWLRGRRRVITRDLRAPI